MLALLLALASPQEVPVELHTTLAEPMRAALAAQVEAIGPVQWRLHRPDALLAALRERRVEGLVVGLEGALLAACADVLQARPRAAPDLLAPCRDPEHRFLVPWLMPVAFVHIEVPPPLDHDELVFDRSFERRIALCGPEIMPGLWIAWMQRQLRQGASPEHGYAWWRTLDARLDSYCSSEADALARLGSRLAAVALVTVPAALAEAPARGLRVHAPAGGMPVLGLGLAATAGAGTQALQMLDALAGAEVAVDLGKRGLALPAPRQGLPLEALPLALRELYPKLLPYDPLEPRAADWLQRFESDVRGRGGRTAWLEDTLDLIFALVFAGVLVHLYLRMRRQP